MLGSKEALFVTDYDKYLLGRGDKKFPTWVWIKDNLDLKTKKEVLELLKDKYLEGYTDVVCKPDFYEYLKDNLDDVTKYYDMGFLQCNYVKEVDKQDGFFDKVRYSDKTRLAKYWQDNCKETNNEDLSLEKCLEEVDNWLKQDTFYVWRKKDGTAVSLAGYGVEKDLAKVTHVYTPKEERCKGYCTSLVYELTKLLLDKRSPRLYFRTSTV